MISGEVKSTWMQALIAGTESTPEVDITVELLAALELCLAQ